MNRTSRLSTILRRTYEKKTNERSEGREREKKSESKSERASEGGKERSQSTIVLSFLLTLLFDYYYTNEKGKKRKEHKSFDLINCSMFLSLCHSHETKTKRENETVRQLPIIIH